MTAPRLIGLSGYAGAGKDEAARVLVAAGWTRVSYADVLREFLVAVDPLVPTPCGIPTRLSALVAQDGYEHAKRTYPEIRQLLQRLGTDAGRRILGENVWVEAALAAHEPLDRIVVTDCRFPNEADAIRARGGVVVRLDRPGCEPVNGHVSETALDGYAFDQVLVNDGTVTDLHLAVLGLLA